jgi:hypothetical protein
MSKDNALVTIVEKTFSLPAKVIVAFLGQILP